MFFCFSQNNSGGSFDFDRERGITHHVIIEAVSADDANSKAEGIGIYFNGVDEGIDCPCCGDRWCSAYSSGNEEPSVYGKRYDAHRPLARWMSSHGKNSEIAIHYEDGTVVWSDGKEE